MSTPLQKAQPWLAPKAIEFLESIIKPEWHVHEWGCGGSTVYFARQCASVVSVEHNDEWVRRTRSRLTELGCQNARVHFVGPDKGVKPGSDPANPEHFRARGIGHASLKTYCQFIEGEHDLVLVDGRARPSCLVEGSKHVKIGGWLVLDDAARSWYQRAVEEVKKDGNWFHLYIPGKDRNGDDWSCTFLQRLF